MNSAAGFIRDYSEFQAQRWGVFIAIDYCTFFQSTKLKAQVERMEAELARWRSGEKVSSEEQISVDMEKSMVSSVVEGVIPFVCA